MGLFKRKDDHIELTPEQIRAIISRSARKELENVQRSEFDEIIFLSNQINKYESSLPYMHERLQQLWASYDERKKILDGTVAE